MTYVYIVEREEGNELDVFNDYDLASKWAELLGTRVREEPILTERALDVMIAAHPEHDGA